MLESHVGRPNQNGPGQRTGESMSGRISVAAKQGFLSVMDTDSTLRRRRQENQEGKELNIEI